MKEKNTIKIRLSTVILIIIIISLIVGMGFLAFKFYEEKNSSKEQIENLNQQINNLKNAVKSSKQNNNTSNIESNFNNKYLELTEEIYNNLAENKYFVLQDVSKNSNGMITLKGRIYEKVELSNISKEEYNSLKNTGSIKLFGETFILGEYEDFVPGYILKNANNQGFYVTDNYELVDFNDTTFVKATNEYYAITLDSNIKIQSETFEINETVNNYYNDFVTIKDYDFINIGSQYNFVFNNGKVEKIIYKF